MICEKCGELYEYVWWAPDDTWGQVHDEYNTLCMHCFDELAWEKGVYLHWGCNAERYPLETELLHLETQAISCAELIQRLRTINAHLEEACADQ